VACIFGHLYLRNTTDITSLINNNNNTTGQKISKRIGLIFLKIVDLITKLNYPK